MNVCSKYHCLNDYISTMNWSPSTKRTTKFDRFMAYVTSPTTPNFLTDVSAQLAFDCRLYVFIMAKPTATRKAAKVLSEDTKKKKKGE